MSYMQFPELVLSDIIWFENNIFPNDSYTTLCMYMEERPARLSFVTRTFHFL